jgi:F0F1-type ATP synthase membrane subunit b/b'
VTTRSRTAVALATLALTASVAVAAADVFQEFGLDRQAWAGSFLSSLVDRAFSAPSFPSKLKGVPEGRRAAVVRALGGAAKAWFASADFRARYAKEVEESLPDDLKPPRSAAEIEASMRSELRQGLTEMEASVKELPAASRKEAEAALAQVRSEFERQAAGLGKAAAEEARAEKARFEAARSRPAGPNALPADPKLALRRALDAFLRETSGVDFAAETRAGASRTRRFVRPDYEAKPRSWKLCYRAGREACDAARAFATEWLAELK